MSAPFPVGIFLALALCLVFFAWLAWFSRCAGNQITARLKLAMAAVFVSIPLLGMGWVTLMILFSMKGR